jgi:polyhydroxyalkanoate synthesis regulator phasin
MNFEEMQQILQDMLRIQRELQESQIKQSGDIQDLRASMADLRDTMTANHEQVTAEIRELARVTSANHGVFTDALGRLIERDVAIDRRIEQLVGYSINRESDYLDVHQDIQDLKRRVTTLEQGQQS